VIDAELDVVEWEPDDGNPISWAVGMLDRRGTFEPSSSPPFTERTWYSGTGVDFARSGATVDVSSHLSGFTCAEVEQIGQRVTAPPAQRQIDHPAPDRIAALALDVRRGRQAASSVGR